MCQIIWFEYSQKDKQRKSRSISITIKVSSITHFYNWCSSFNSSICITTVYVFMYDSSRWYVSIYLYHLSNQHKILISFSFRRSFFLVIFDWFEWCDASDSIISKQVTKPFSLFCCGFGWIVRSIYLLMVIKMGFHSEFEFTRKLQHFI